MTPWAPVGAKKLSSVSLEHEREGWWPKDFLFVYKFYLWTLIGIIRICQYSLSVYVYLQLLWTAPPPRLCSLFEIKYPNIMCIYYYHVKYHIWCVCTWVEYKAIDNFIASFMKISLYSPNKKRRFGTTMKAGLRTLANTALSSCLGGQVECLHGVTLRPCPRCRGPGQWHVEARGPALQLGQPLLHSNLEIKFRGE